jgi:mevalonate kinase
MTTSKAVRLRRDTISRLAKYGRWGESADEVVNRVLDLLEQKTSSQAELYRKLVELLKKLTLMPPALLSEIGVNQETLKTLIEWCEARSG